MTDKIVLANLVNLQNETSAVNTINANNAVLVAAIDNTLSRDGTTPNQMVANLDMNNNQILNLPSPATVDSPARLVDVVTNPTILVPPVGTSGAVVGLLNTNKTDSGNNTFSGVNTFSGNDVLSGNNTLGGNNTFSGTNTHSGTESFTGPVSFTNPTFPAGTFWNNTRNAKTGTYTVVNADKLTTLALGGSAYYTVTFSAASTYDANFAVVLTNEDSTVSGGNHTGRGKKIAINGYPSFILWPGQTMILMNQNNVWRFEYPGRWRVQGQPTIYVDHANGNDTNDGLVTGTGAFATIQAAVIAYESWFDFNNFGPTIQVANETFTENNVSHTHPLVGYHVFSLTGNTTTPSNCVWQVSGTGNVAINCRDCGLAIVTGFKFVSTGTNNLFINGGQDGVCDFGSIEFGSNPGGFHLDVSPGGACNWFGGTVTLSGNMGGFLLGIGEGHCLLDGMVLSIPNPLTFSNFFQLTGPHFTSVTALTVTGSGAGSGSTGRKWSVTGNAVLSIGASAIPGATTGVTSTGGQQI